MLSPEQKERLQIIHSYEWAVDDSNQSRANLCSLYQQITTPEELWFASFIIALDPTNGSWSMILDHPSCDKGIALRLYWSLNPCTVLRQERVGPLIDILQHIETRLMSGYYRHEKVAFSPAMLGRNICSDLVPAELCQDTCGLQLPLDYRQAVFH